MRLKNKKTGEIGYLYEHSLTQDMIIVYNVKGIVGKYNSLAELNEEWEDAPEEPKEFWTINTTFDCAEPIVAIQKIDKRYYGDEDAKSIGNYFETKEEAEKAVKKLKAWKRLKDKGIKIGKRRHSAYGGEMYWECPNGTGITDKQIWLDLDLLFGGEE